MGKESRLKEGSGELEWWAVKSVFSGSHPWCSCESLALWNTPTSACRYTLSSAHQMCDSACQYDWRWAWLVLTPSLTHPSLQHTHPHRHIQSYPCFPSVTLSSEESSVASPKGRPLIAAVRWDGLLGFEFQMTEQWSWYAHRGSCWGTVLPLLWPGANRPAPKPGAQYRQTWWQSDLIHPSQWIFISNHVPGYKYHMFTHTAFTFTYICITDSLVRFSFNLQPKIPPN